MTTPRNAAHEALLSQILKTFGTGHSMTLWENKTGMAYRNKRPIYYGLKGSADILGIRQGGQMLCIEVKTGTARQTVQQKSFQKMITERGGLYILAYSIDDVKKALIA